MKKGIILVMMIVLGAISLMAQQRYEVIDTVYVNADTVTIAPTYTNSFDGSKTYDGVAGFMFTILNRTDTLRALYFEGSYDGTNFALVDSITSYVNGTQSMQQAPPIYTKYRLRALTITGDIVSLKDLIYFEKVPRK